MPIFVERIWKGSEVVLAVEDVGPGIHAEDAPQIFEPFYRSTQTRRRGIAGVGLQLPGCGTPHCGFPSGGPSACGASLAEGLASRSDLLRRAFFYRIGG